MMLEDNDKNARSVGVAKVLAHRKQVAATKVQITMTIPCTEQHQFDSLVRCTNSELGSRAASSMFLPNLNSKKV